MYIKIICFPILFQAYGGLRGAVAFSLVDLLEHGDFQKNTKDMFMTTCLALIFFTVFVQVCWRRVNIVKFQWKEMCFYVGWNLTNFLTVFFVGNIYQTTSEVLANQPTRRKRFEIVRRNQLSRKSWFPSILGKKL